MEHQSPEDARKWEDSLDSPLPGTPRRESSRAAANELDQLKHL